MKTTRRKVIQIAVSETPNSEENIASTTVVALCDDGTIWYIISECGGMVYDKATGELTERTGNEWSEWKELEPIPE